MKFNKKLNRYTFWSVTSYFRHACKRWGKKNSGILAMEIQIPMFVKYVLSRQPQQFFFHAGIFVVSIFFAFIFCSFLVLSLFSAWITTSCLPLQCVNLVHSLVLNVQYAAQILQIGFLLLLLDSLNKGLAIFLYTSHIQLLYIYKVITCFHFCMLKISRILSHWTNISSRPQVQFFHQNFCM